MKSPRDLATDLLTKAGHDLLAARAILATGQALDMACFHAQQAVEKGLKALLALKDVPYPWRHDLAELLDMVGRHFPRLDLPADDLAELSPYAVEARYDEAWAPDIHEARQAVDLAERSNALILKVIQLP